MNKDNLSFITDEQVKKMIEITTTFSLNKWLYMVRQAKFRRNVAWCIEILKEKERTARCTEDQNSSMGRSSGFHTET